MKIERTDVWGFKHALRGMRNPMNSWDKSDSKYLTLDEADGDFGHLTFKDYIIGDNDFDLMQRLINGGSEHRKFMRQIMVSVDITAPMFWWSEFDTYKIGTTANSTSKMHKLASKPITIEDFEMDDYEGHLLMYEREPYDLDAFTDDMWDNIINYCETLRKSYLETKDKRYWKELIRILPESYLQTRTVTMNYENLYSIVRQRKGHKLTEWSSFIDWVHGLPYANELIFYNY